MNLRSLSFILSCCALSLANSAAFAAAPVVAQAPGVAITVDDLRAEAERIPAGQRAEALSNPDAVQQAASNLFVRRTLAAEAVRDGLDKDPLVAAALQLVRDRLLSDVRLAAIDTASKPSDAAIESGARAAYQANPARYRSDEQSQVRHILFTGDPEKAKADADKVLAELKGGASFEALAKARSADPVSAARGGDLGYAEPGQMVPEFETAVASLKQPGDLSAPVQTKFGWHIIQLVGRRPAGQRSFDEVRDELRKTVANQMQSDARLREVSRLVDTVKFDRDAIDAFSATYRK